MNEQETTAVDRYRILSRLRDQLKRVQQLSWNITQFEKRFPFEKVTPEQEEALFKAYYEFAMDMFIINKVFGIVLQEAKTRELVPKA